MKKIEEVYTAHVEYRENNPKQESPIFSRKQRFNIDIPVTDTVLPDHLMDEPKKVDEKPVEKPQPAVKATEEVKQEEVAPSVISFQKAKEQRDQYLHNHQKAESSDSIEDLLPPAMKTPEDAPKEKKKDPIIEALINKAVQPPKLTEMESSFSQTLSEQNKIMNELTDQSIISELLQPKEELPPNEILDAPVDEEDAGFSFDFGSKKTNERPKLTLVEPMVEEDASLPSRSRWLRLVP